jgi:hypothetical protein
LKWFLHCNFIVQFMNLLPLLKPFSRAIIMVFTPQLLWHLGLNYYETRTVNYYICVIIHRYSLSFASAIKIAFIAIKVAKIRQFCNRNLWVCMAERNPFTLQLLWDSHNKLLWHLQLNYHDINNRNYYTIALHFCIVMLWIYTAIKIAFTAQ